MGRRGLPVADILAARRWRPHRLAAEDAIGAGRVSSDGICAVDRWFAHLEGRGAREVTSEEVLDFFASSVSPVPISRLQCALHAIAPADPHLPAISRALRLRDAAYAPRNEVRARSVRPTVSIEIDALPAAWQEAVADMRAGIARGCKAPAPAIVDTIEMKLRQLAFSAGESGVPVELDIPALSAFVQAMMGRALAATTIASTLGKLRTFAIYTSVSQATTDAIVSEQRHHDGLARLDGKRKARFLARTGLSIADVAQAALDCHLKAEQERNPRIRHFDWLRGALFAFTICRALRPLDIRSLVIGRTLRRDAEGWALYAHASKNRYELVGRLWDICTPFLDGAILLGVGEAHLRDAYAHAEGRLLLANRDGSALCDNWATDQFRVRFGTGIGIMRTLWHDLCAGLGTEEALRAALAICGQHDPRTAGHYRTQMSERTLLAQGQALLAEVSEEASRGMHRDVGP